MFLENFSKAGKKQKMQKVDDLLQGKAMHLLDKYQLSNQADQQIIDDISENVISNYHLPYSIAPNFLINGKMYHLPMVTEESSVVAAAASAAKFWSKNGGFHCKVFSTLKTGQIHFIWSGRLKESQKEWALLHQELLKSVAGIISKMESRGGGIRKIHWQEDIQSIPDYHRLHVEFETMDAMGANFINSCLETMSVCLKEFLEKEFTYVSVPEIIMCILSNHVPECLVECTVSCKTDELKSICGNLSPQEFAHKFVLAVRIAQINVYRAVTHNKGIFNGIDAVALATANDFRALEAGGHAYAGISGQYKSLSRAFIENDIFTLKLTIPLAVGTVGGLISVHPLAKLSMQILGNPSAEELMQIMAAAGLSNNFSAVKALITSGIQQGHMKLHLPNIMNQLQVTEIEKEKVKGYFRNQKVSFAAVENYISELRSLSQKPL